MDSVGGAEFYFLGSYLQLFVFKVVAKSPSPLHICAGKFH